MYSYCVLMTIKKITLAVSHRIRKQEYRQSQKENGTVGRERRNVRENELTSNSSFTENCLLRNTLEKQEDTTYRALLW
jgi:hypothetical protein